MGLGKKADEVDDSSSNSGSGNTGSNGSPDSSDGSDEEYPQYQKWFPYGVVYEDLDGEFHFVHQPHNFEFEKIKNTENSSWSLQHKTQGFNGVPSNVKRYWKDRVDLLRGDRMVKKIFDMSVLSEDDGPAMIKTDPERACELISKAAKEYSLSDEAKQNKQQKKKTHRNCPVCDKGIDIRYGSYEKVNRQLVCPDHSVKQLRENGLID